MEYVYAALLLHSTKKEISEANLKKVVEAAGVAPEEAKIKALVASVEGVNINDAIKQSVAVAAPVASAAPADKKEEKKEEKKSEEEAAGGLANLFG